METLKALFLTALVVASCQGANLRPVDTVDLPPLDRLCATVRCGWNTRCRVVQNCAGPACPPQAACISCVPESVDDVCNNHRYYYAVLVGPVNSHNHHFESQLEERKCNPAQPGGPPNCPQGSTCVSDGNGRGTCCFGKPDPAPEPGSPISNDFPVCPRVDRCGGCEKDEICKKIIVQCLTYPCDPQYQCVPKVKPGSCPYWPAYIPINCPKKPERRCREDHECPGRKKCCTNQCGDFLCTDPLFRKG